MHISKPFLRNAAASCIMASGLLLVHWSVFGQTFTTLHSFNGEDGANPFAGLCVSGKTLYGTTVTGGNSDLGTIFAINTDGSAFTNLYSFTGGSDGAHPYANLIVSSNTLYGTTFNANAHGTIFKVLTNGTGFSTLYTFTGGSDGCNPSAGLTLAGNTLYGASSDGGIADCTAGYGTLFALQTDGTGFTVLHTFTGGLDGDGATVNLTLSGTTLYGATPGGGASNWGTLFSLRTDGTLFRTVYSFTGTGDQGNPSGTLLLSGSSLYGTTRYYIGLGYGTIFRVSTNGAGFTTLYTFQDNDGAEPCAGVVGLGNSLYGTANIGGAFNFGTVFKLNTNGTAFATLHDFSQETPPGCYGCPNPDGANPYAPLLVLDNTLYGTAYTGGTYAKGTVFSISFQPQLAIVPLNTNVVLSWATNLDGFDFSAFALQSTTNLVSNLWTPVSQVPVIVNGQNVVTQSLSGVQQFYRLVK